jgi:hypothetical protein
VILTPGSKYIIRFRQSGMIRDRQMTATFIGGAGGYKDFDLRPDGGTARLLGDQIVSVQLTNQEAPTRLPEIVTP